MDPIIAAGVFIVGVGLGLASPKTEKTDPPTSVTCQCECGTEKVPEVVHHPFRDFLVTLVIGIFIGIILVLGIRWYLLFQSSLGSLPVSPKGKGRKGGAFGSPVALQITS